ncbi:hypothetical protein ACVW00_001958 [Marmoricola sp. URHA0025 HA25]
MDAAPRELRELPMDAELGVPVPFACGTASYGAPRDGNPPTVRRLDGRRVTQCALSRVCGVCGAGLGRPIAFLGSAEEADRNAFHFPPCHLECARVMLDAVADLDVPVLGQVVATTSWVLTTTAAFEFVRPLRGDADLRPTFQPHEVLTETR